MNSGAERVAPKAGRSVATAQRGSEVLMDAEMKSDEDEDDKIMQERQPIFLWRSLDEATVK